MRMIGKSQQSHVSRNSWCQVCVSVSCHEIRKKLQPPCFSGNSVPCHEIIENPQQSHMVSENSWCQMCFCTTSRLKLLLQNCTMWLGTVISHFLWGWTMCMTWEGQNNSIRNVPFSVGLNNMHDLRRTKQLKQDHNRSSWHAADMRILQKQVPHELTVDFKCLIAIEMQISCSTQNYNDVWQ
jgi:hypothetical protein